MNGKAKAMGYTNAMRRWENGEANSPSGVRGGNEGTHKIFCKTCNAYVEFEAIPSTHVNRNGQKMACFTCKTCKHEWYAVDRNANRGNSTTLGDLVIGNVGITLKIKGKTPEFAKPVLKDMGLYSEFKIIPMPTFDDKATFTARCKCGKTYAHTYPVKTFRCTACYGTEFRYIQMSMD